MLFNDAESLSYEDIAAATAIPEDDLKRVLQSLACVKVRSLFTGTRAFLGLRCPLTCCTRPHTIPARPTPHVACFPPCLPTALPPSPTPLQGKAVLGKELTAHPPTLPPSHSIVSLVLRKADVPTTCPATHPLRLRPYPQGKAVLRKEPMSKDVKVYPSHSQPWFTHRILNLALPLTPPTCLQGKAVLRKEPMSKDVKAGDAFSVNDAFTSKLYKVKIGMVTAQVICDLWLTGSFWCGGDRVLVHWRVSRRRCCCPCFSPACPSATCALYNSSPRLLQRENESEKAETAALACPPPKLLHLISMQHVRLHSCVLAAREREREGGDAGEGGGGPQAADRGGHRAHHEGGWQCVCVAFVSPASCCGWVDGLEPQNEAGVMR